MSNNYSPRRSQRRSAPGSLRPNSANISNVNIDHDTHNMNQVLNGNDWSHQQHSASPLGSSDSARSFIDIGSQRPTQQQHVPQSSTSTLSGSFRTQAHQQGSYMELCEYPKSSINSILPPTKANEIICDYGCCQRELANDYIYKEAYLKGTHSDCKIRAFNKTYKFHKLFLCRSGYFNSLFNWSNNTKFNNSNDGDNDDDGDDDDDDDDDNENYGSVKAGEKNYYELKFDDERITQESFELAISRLYYAAQFSEEISIPHSMVAIGQYLDIPEIVTHSLQHILNSLNISNLAEHLEFATSYNYGVVSDQIIEYSKGTLCEDGWQVGAEKWDNLPLDIITEVVGEDYFFVPTEWDRCMFIIKLIERRLEKKFESDGSSDPYDSEAENLQPLKDVLNSKIYYVHFTPEQLFELETYYDINGESYINPQILHMALWKAMNLRSTILQSLESNSSNIEKEIISTFPPNKTEKWFKIPKQDETLSGLPRDLHKSLLQNLNSTKPNVSPNSSMTKNGPNDYEMITKTTETQPQLLNEPNGNNTLSSWTRIPPFRFSIAFANVSDLLTDKRVYGKLFWYAGSYWNLYLQKNHIPQKTTGSNTAASNDSSSSFQIGVYLHRANNGSSLSACKNGILNPDVFANNVNYQNRPKKYPPKESIINNNIFNGADSFKQRIYSNKLNGDQEKDNEFEDNVTPLPSFQSLQINSEDNNSSVSSSSLHLPGSTHQTSRPSSASSAYVPVKSSKFVDKTAIEYEDPRTSIPVYFIIFTPSRREKSTITSFLSVPNSFNKSQSWGWKSNSMCIFNEDGSFPPNHDPHLKFSIVLGNV